MEKDRSPHAFNGLVRNCSALDHPHPAPASIIGYPDTFFIEVSLDLSLSLSPSAPTYTKYYIFHAGSIEVKNLTLDDHKVLVLWK